MREIEIRVHGERRYGTRERGGWVLRPKEGKVDREDGDESFDEHKSRIREE